MAKVRRIIQKIEPVRELGFEQQFWPIVIALCVLGGFVYGASLALLDGVWLWISLIAVPIVVLSLIVILHMVDNRLVRRSVQLALILSLAIHIALLIIAHFASIFNGVFVPKNVAQDAISKPRVVNQYVTFDTKTFKEVKKEEVPIEEIEEVTKKEVEPETAPEQPQPTPVAEPKKEVTPAVVRKQEQADSTPRRNEELSKLSRQELQVQPKSGTSAEAVQTKSTESKLTPNKTEVQKKGEANSPASQVKEAPQTKPSEAESQIVKKREQQQADQPSDSVAEQPQPKKLNRSQELATNVGANTKVEVETPQQSKQKVESTIDKTEVENRQVTSQTNPQNKPVKDVVVPETVNNPLLNDRSQKTAERKSESQEKPAQLARASAAQSPVVTTPMVSSSKRVEQPTSQANQSNQSSAEEALKPTETKVAQQQPTKTVTPTTQTPDASKAEVSPNPKTDVAATRKPNRAEPTPVAQANTSVMKRSESTEPLTAQTKTEAQTSQQQSVTKSNTPQPSPTSTQVAQQPTRTPSSTVSRQPAVQETSSTVPQVAKSVPKRENATSPSISTDSPASQQPRRTLAVAANASSPTSVEDPTTSTEKSSDGKGNPQATSLTLARSDQGVTGKGSSANVMTESPASDRPSLQASNSRRRNEPTRNAPADNALAPSSSSEVPRSAAGQVVPRSSLAADNVPNPQESGERQPSTLTANASPATVDAAAQAQAASVSADAGTSSIDLGPVKVVSESSNGRASGGGQPELNSPKTATKLDRSSSAAGSLPSIAATAETVDAASPETTGSGEPQPNENDLDATSLVRMDAGAAQPTTAGPSNAQTEGPTSEVNTALEQSSKIASRAAPAESAPGEQTAGGGMPTDDASAKLIRAEMAGGPNTSSVALVENPSTASPKSNANGPTMLADISGIDAPSVESASSNAGEAALQKLAGGVTGSNDPSNNVDLSGGSPATRRTKSELAVSDAQGDATAAASVARQGFAPTIATTVSADDAGDISAAASGEVESDGESSLAATDVNVEAASGGAVASGQPGGSDGPMTTDVAAELGTAGGKRKTDQGDVGSLSQDQAAGQLGRKQLTGELAADASADTSEIEIPTSESGGGTTAAGQLDGLADVELAQREANGGESVDVKADMGPGGLGALAATESGLNNRRSRQELGPLQAFVNTPFFRENPGGVPTYNKTAIFARQAFRARGEREVPAAGGPTTEESIELGLQYLAQIQRDDGRWMLQNGGDEEVAMQTDTAATGLAMLAFQGAGYNHREYKYAEQLKKSVDWLLANQQADGNLYVAMDETSNASCALYSHGIAALALCEAYGMTQDAALKEPAQRALDFIAASQDKSLGGWRYVAGRGADTSVTGWMMMALKSGKLAGLETDQDTMNNIRNWLGVAHTADESYLYRYNPYAQDEGKIIRSHGRKPTPCMTSVGLLMQLYSGWNRENADLIKGADYLLTQMPSDTDKNLRDTYYWYYATQVLRHIGGERWDRWHNKLHPLLVRSQIPDGPHAGSWDPLGAVPDRWGAHGGRLYVTAMNLLSLEVDYRLLPLYDKTVE